MKKRFVLFFAALTMLQTAALAQTNPLIKYLPDNSAMVMNFNAVGIASKIPGESFRQSIIYQQIMKDPGMPFNTLLMNPEKSGIDFSAGIFLAITNDEPASNSSIPPVRKPEPGVNIFIKLQNAALFTANMKELFKDKDDSIRTFGTDKILQTEKGMTFGWNNDFFVMTSANDSKVKQELLELWADTTTRKDFDLSVMQVTDKLKNAQRNLCFSLLAPKSQSSLSSNSRFLSLMSMTGDIKTWNNGMTNPFLGNKLMGLTSSALSKLMAFTGKNKTSVVNFENGKIVMQSSTYPNDDVAAVYKKYPKTTLNTDLTRRLPKGDILAIINTSYNPQMGMELIQKSGIKEMMEEIKSPVPFDFNLITAAFGSNMLLAVIKADESTTVDSLTKSMDGIKLVMAMPIASKAKFDELKTTVKKLIDSMQQGEVTPKIMKGMNPAIKYTDSLFVLSLSPTVAADFINNTGTEPALEWLQAKNQYPMVMAVNMKAILKMVLGKKQSAKNGKEEEMLMNMFDEMIVYGGNYENESLNTTMEFQFSNKADNALKQLFDMISLIAGKNERVINEEKEGAKVDIIKLEAIEQVKEDKVPPPPPSKSPKNVIIKPATKVKKQ